MNNSGANVILTIIMVLAAIGVMASIAVTITTPTQIAIRCNNCAHLINTTVPLVEIANGWKPRGQLLCKRCWISWPLTKDTIIYI